METLFSRILITHYNQTLIDISEQEGGWSARAFRVKTNSGIFFLKVYDKKMASTKIWTAALDTYMPIVLWLYNNTDLHGKIICPMPTKNGSYKCEDDQYIYLLFPYIEGYTIGDKPLVSTQVKEIAEIIAQLHTYGSIIPVPTQAIREDFAVPFCQALKKMIESIDISIDNDTFNILYEYKLPLLKNIEKTEVLAAKLSKENLPYVLCHTDVHGWNLMQSDRLILIDWEGMKLAPPEADLFAFIGNRFWHTCSEEFMDTYQKIHPDYEINPDVLDFYQTRRRIEDICAFAQGLLYEELHDKDKKLSLSLLRRECSALLLSNE